MQHLSLKQKNSVIFQYFVFDEQLKFHAQLSRAYFFIKVSKGAKIRNRYNQVPHLTQDTIGKVTNS